MALAFPPQVFRNCTWIWFVPGWKSMPRSSGSVCVMTPEQPVL